MASFYNNAAQNGIIVKMTSLINKLADWLPNYHKAARTFPKSSAPHHSMKKLTLNEPAMKKMVIYTFADLRYTMLIYFAVNRLEKLKSTKN